MHFLQLQIEHIKYRREKDIPKPEKLTPYTLHQPRRVEMNTFPGKSPQ